jgi:hypothetical protein
MLELKLDLIQILKPRRKITGISALLLPFTHDTTVDMLRDIGQRLSVGELAS